MLDGHQGAQQAALAQFLQHVLGQLAREVPLPRADDDGVPATTGFLTAFAVGRPSG